MSEACETMDDQLDGVLLSQRRVPFPSSISEQACRALQRMVGADGVPFNALYSMPASDDRAAWIALQSSVNGQHAAEVAKRVTQETASAATVTVDHTIVHVATPGTMCSEDFAYIDLHGGALVFGGGDACRMSAQIEAEKHCVRCYGVDYRMPPDHPYPAALDDCLTAYRYVLERHSPNNVIIGGRSAGGNLAAAMLLRGRDEGLPMPSALVLLSPELDLTESGDSFEVNRMVDVVLPDSLMSCNHLYAGGADLAHPYLSPLFGDLDGLPPTFLQTGTRDLFLSNAVRMHRKLRRANIAVELHVFEGMPHGGFSGEAPEDLELIQEVKRFVRSRWQ
jgi:acetyl esterase/lipase